MTYLRKLIHLKSFSYRYNMVVITHPTPPSFAISVSNLRGLRPGACLALWGRLCLVVSWTGTAFGKGAPDPPPSRLRQHENHTTPGFRPGLHETAATLLYLLRPPCVVPLSDRGWWGVSLGRKGSGKLRGSVDPAR